ncbi:MAG: hypothetical protein Q7T23_09105 [Phenylobacterium sp.]|nr:hypothetical protein [Phenylobacterium sp.]
MEMAMERRRFLSLMGGGVLAGATAGAVGFALTREPKLALAPWSAAGRRDDVRLGALSYAILAPNPHNRQPWLADVRTPGQVTLHVDRTRLLPHTDPLNRQITIGLGCFLELMVMAAAEAGDRVDLELFPDGETPQGLTSGRVAIARFVRDGTVRPDPLFAHVLARRSNKEPFDTARLVDPAVVPRILAAARHGPAVDASLSPTSVAALRSLTERALRIEIATPRTYRESVDLFRIGRAEVEANPDGIDFTGVVFEGLARVGQFDRQVALDPKSMAYQQGVGAVIENAASATGHVWMVSAQNRRIDQIAAGRDWVRMNLAATRESVGWHPLSQALQEFPEMAGLYREAHARLAPRGGTVQMLCRIGHGATVGPSPRWPLEAKLVAA